MSLLIVKWFSLTPAPLKKLFFLSVVFILFFLSFFAFVAKKAEHDNSQVFEHLRTTPLNQAASSFMPALHYYSVDTDVFYDDILDISCTGHSFKRVAYVYYVDKETGKTLELPVTDRMDKLSYRSRNQYLDQYYFGPFQISYLLLRQYFPKIRETENLKIDSAHLRDWQQLESGYEFFLGEDPKKPKGDDIKLEYSCQEFSPSILLLSTNDQQLRLKDIQASFDPEISLEYQLEIKEGKQNYKISGGFFWQAFVLLSFFIHLLMVLSQELVIKLWPIVRSPFLLLFLLCSVLAIPASVVVELAYLCFLGLFLMIRFVAKKQLRKTF
jgi:hypothetical protein